MQPGFTLTSAFAKASAVALRAMADKTADRLALCPACGRQASREREHGAAGALDRKKAEG